jgi:heme exporter protein B
MLSAAAALLKRDLKLAFRARMDALQPVLFFALLAVLVPFGVGPDLNRLQAIAPGMLTVGALLATLLSLDAVFARDADDASLEVLMLAPQPLALLCLSKILAHWLISAVPCLLAFPILATLFNLNGDAWRVAFVALLLATPTLSAVGAIGAALTVSVARGGTLLALLTLPLNVPTLIFAASAIESAQAGLAVNAQIYFLSALALFSLSLSPLACALALRLNAR